MKLKLTLLTSILFAASSPSLASSVALEDCGRTAEAFAFITDASGSMMQTIGDVKKKAQKEARFSDSQSDVSSVPRADEAVDDLTREALAKRFIEKTAVYAITSADMESSVLTVGPFTELIPLAKRSADDFKKEFGEKLPDDLEVFGRSTWVGERAFNRFSESLAQSQASVLITDGNFEVDPDNGYLDPVETLKAFYTANPKACIHIVSAAYTQAERDGIEKLAAVSDCARVDNLEDLMKNEALWKNFVEEVFYKDCSQVETVVLRGINFAFDKSEIGENGKKILNDALKIVAAKDPALKITIRGWTDWTGSDAYNAGLSQRRADAVKAYFVEHGVDPARLTSEGMGKSFKYTNYTGDGRWMNRRVDLIFGDSLVSEDATTRTEE